MPPVSLPWEGEYAALPCSLLRAPCLTFHGFSSIPLGANLKELGWPRGAEEKMINLSDILRFLPYVPLAVLGPVAALTSEVLLTSHSWGLKKKRQMYLRA